MWLLKFKVLNKDSIYTLESDKNNIVDYMYPVDYYMKGKSVNILSIHLLEGDEKEKKKFISAVKRNKKVKRCELIENQLITLIAEEEDFYKTLFSAEMYHPAPVLIEKGTEVWSIASWDRTKLEKLMKEIEKWKDKFPRFELLSLARMNLNDVYFPKIKPHLPERQQRAFDLALKRGYYTWPRKIDLSDLAKEMGISIATVQEHLRKAEAKLLPFFAGKK
ncbi:MAG: helix-turn-helix domain-containing protein [archaeon]